MSQRVSNTLVRNMLTNSMHITQKLEFDNEDLFNAWIDSERNKIGWLLHDRYLGSRESTVS